MKKENYAWKILILCCCLSGAIAGMCIHCRGIFYNPASKGLGISPTTYATYSTFGGFAGVLFMPLITRIFNKKKIKVVLSIYLLFFCGCTVLLGYATKMWQCYIIGCIQGVFSSFLTLYPIAYLIRNWFTKKRGLATGIATMFAGISSSIMNMILNNVIIQIGWRSAYKLLGLVAFVIAVIPVLCFAIKSPEEIGVLPFGGNPDISIVEKNKVKKATMNSKLFLEMIPVAVLVIAFYMSSGYNQHLSNFAISNGYSATIGASFISICMIGNVISKLVLGVLNDSIGVYKTSLISVLLMAGSFITLVFFPSMIICLYIACFFLGQATAFIVVQIPLLLSELFPIQSEYETCLPIVMMIGSLTGSLNNVLINTLYSINKSYSVGHILAFVLLLLCAGIIIFLNLKNKKKSYKIS